MFEIGGSVKIKPSRIPIYRQCKNKHEPYLKEIGKVEQIMRNTIVVRFGKCLLINVNRWDLIKA